MIKNKQEWLRQEVDKLGFTVDFCDYDNSFSIYGNGYALISMYDSLDRLNIYDFNVSFKDIKRIIEILQQYKEME